MKAMHVFISMPVGGAEDLVLSIVRNAQPESLAEVVCIQQRGVAGQEASDEGLPVHLLPVVRRKQFNPIAVLRLARWLRKQKVDVVHSHVYNAHVYAVLAAKMAGIPVVMHHHKTFNRDRKRRWMILRSLARWTSAQITLSEKTRDDLIQALKVSPQTCSVLSNVVDESIFRPVADKAAAKQKVGLNPARPLLGGVASLNTQKNHTATVAMMATLAQQKVTCAGVICGEGGLRADLQNQIDRESITDRLRLVGNQRPIAPWLQAFDVLVLPSTWEGQPMVLLQALACGIPIVASAIEGNIATLGPDHPGLFPLDPQPAKESRDSHGNGTSPHGFSIPAAAAPSPQSTAYAHRVRAILLDPLFRHNVLAHQQATWTAQPKFPTYLAALETIYRQAITAHKKPRKAK